MTLPSKELLSEVLDIKVVEVYKIGSNPNFKDNTLLYRVEGCGDLFTINIHELAHKCKEWANIKKGMYLSSGYDEVDKKWEAMMMQITFVADTEPEAIFKACQWILDNKEI